MNSWGQKQNVGNAFSMIEPLKKTIIKLKSRKIIVHHKISQIYKKFVTKSQINDKAYLNQNRSNQIRIICKNFNQFNACFVGVMDINIGINIDTIDISIVCLNVHGVREEV